VNTYELGTLAAMEKFAVNSDWAQKRFAGGVQSRLARLGPGAAAQSLKEFEARQTARAAAIPEKLRKATSFERLLGAGLDLALLPVHALTGGAAMSRRDGMIDANEFKRVPRSQLAREARAVLGGFSSKGVPPEVAQKYQQGATIPNKPNSLLTGDVLRKALGRK
jgi:hypothetical protein